MVGETEYVGVGEPTIYIKSDHTSDEFKCDQCTSSFGRKGALARHKRMKHTLRKCEECDFVTCERWEADYHFLTMHPPDMWIEKSALGGMIMERTF